MKLQIVGFEGSLQESFDATWGTAALREGDELVNPTTGFRSPIARLDTLAEKGALHRFSKPINLPKEIRPAPFVVVAVREESAYQKYLALEVGRHGGIVKRLSRDGAICYILRSREALRQYADDVTQLILKDATAGKTATKKWLPAVRAGLALDSSQPLLNAFRAYISLGDTRTHQLARACTRGEQGRTAFDTFFSALSGGSAVHELHYKKGIAEGGGLDVDPLLELLKDMWGVMEKLTHEVKKDWPFLSQIASPRLHALQPGSAKLVFTPEVASSTISDRVGRYLTLRALERALHGEFPRDLRGDTRFENSLEHVIQPSKETKLWQKPLDSDRATFVAPEEFSEGTDLEIEDLELLGILTGYFADAGRLEIRLLSGAHRRLSLSTRNDGEGGEPEGVHSLQASNVPFFRLTRLQIRRESDDAGHERFRLRRLEFLTPGQSATIQAVPSTIVPGAYRLTRTIQVRRVGRHVVVGDHEIGPPFVESENKVGAWLEDYERICRIIELNDPRMKWAATKRPPPVSVLARVIVSLHHLGGTADAGMVAEEIGRRFARRQRENNTRREAIRHPELVTFVEGDEHVMQLTNLGRAFMRAYEKAGGDPGEAPETD